LNVKSYLVFLNLNIVKESDEEETTLNVLPTNTANIDTHINPPPPSQQKSKRLYCKSFRRWSISLKKKLVIHFYTFIFFKLHWKDIMLSNSLNFYLPKSNRCYENYVYLSNISIRSFVLLAYPLLFFNLCIFCKKSCYVIIMLLFFSVPLYLAVWE
jgi:hypothetical protein